MGPRFPINRSVVDYDVARQMVQSGDLLLCSGRNLISWLIRWLTRSDWSHVAIVVRLPGIDRVMVLESVMLGGVRAVPLSSFVHHQSNPKNPYFGRLIIARHGGVSSGLMGNKLGFYRTGLDLFGREYDFREALAIFIRLILYAPRFSNLNRRTIGPRNNKYICSEYVDECYQALGISIPNDGDGFIAPVHFAADPNVNIVARLK